jgi:membrane fusion protein (multidrug efflux system)
VAVDARVDPSTRNATVRARIDDPVAALTPGASVRVRVPEGPQQKAAIIPVSALRKGPGGDHVFVLETAENGETRAHLRQVQAGMVLGDSAVVLSGLAAGERVAASGSFKLREAVLVQVAEPAPVNAVSAR